ncbi:phosphodiesterase [Arthrobacter sp. RCC_34]|uniref:phosphodiesterase n=1 Tax=Arthrobacter sp. RCC_34 TaxID=3239230 RepID=UPI003524E09C
MSYSIAHLSDSHLRAGALVSSPAEALHTALRSVLALDPPPDCVVITGDLVEHGTAEEYRVLQEVVAGFPLPLKLVAGNHDEPGDLVAAFGGSDLLGRSTSTHYVEEFAGFALVVLDSWQAGVPSGRLGPEQLYWLDGTLASLRAKPVFVALHHPPAPVGIPFLDGMRLEDEDKLADVIARHPHVVRVLAGHVHRAVTAPFAGTMLAVAPSTYLASGLTLDGSVPHYRADPTSYLLHLGDGPQWVTHVVPVSHAAAPIAGF